MSRALRYRLTSGAMCARLRQRWQRRSIGRFGCESGRHRQSRSERERYPPASGRPTSAELGLRST
eukprot:1499128-Pleurochrysis_carterae.AAC.1